MNRGICKKNKACFGIRLRNAEQSFALNVLMNRDIFFVRPHPTRQKTCVDKKGP
ncbi:MAG: hypothetical protein JRE14_15030 [Deltaproteobacteria bacterium]|nr:hypothetical protein [Deltaproteobacteria bacterium]